MPTKSIARSPRNNGFTLIELLTVIAIIGILAAILIPVVGKVRENARRIQCGSNMRQVALAVLTYESEQGVLPGPTERDVQSPLAGDARRGANLAKEYWRFANVDLSLILEDYIGKYNEGDPGPFHCESNVDNTTMSSNLRPVFLLMRNVQTNPRSFFGDMDINEQPKRLNQIVAAGRGTISRQASELTQIWMISDIDGGNYGASSGTGDDAPLSSKPPHDGGRNYVFFDGHVEFCKPLASGKWVYPASTGDPGNHGQ